MTLDDAEVTRENLEIWSIRLPLPVPVATVIGLFESLAVVVVVLEIEGVRGYGFASFPSGDDRDDAVGVIERRVRQGALFRDLLHPAPTIEEPGVAAPVVHGATSALSCAAWDAQGRRASVSCARLWRPGSPGEAKVYASGLFLGSDDSALLGEAEQLRSEGYQLVKMRVGGDPLVDAERVALVQRVFPRPGAVAVDAYQAWDPVEASRFVEAAPGVLAWIEDPVPMADIARFDGRGTPLALGENCTTLEEIDHLLADAKGETIAVLDVQNLGGPDRLLEAGNALLGRGVKVSPHVFPRVSAHLAASLAANVWCEYLDWWDLLFEGPFESVGGIHRLPEHGIGHEVRRDHLARWGHVIGEI